ncbi:MAG: hypothetical protein ABIP93_15055 [Gemmatimonadaceae bacterium]
MATDVYVTNEVNVDVNDLPTVDVNVLDGVDVSSLPDIRITDIGPMGPLSIAGIPTNYTVGVSSMPDVNLRIREIPALRVHIPANFRLGVSVLGFELAALHLCGEAQVITEPYVANPCEGCGPQRPIPPRNNEVGAVLRLKNG